MAGIREDWLARTVEAPLEPDLEIVDPHHHFWDRPDGRYLPADLAADFGGLRVVATVFVECGSGFRGGGPEHLRPVGETEYVHALAEAARADATAPACAIAAAIVPFADCNLGEAVAEVLDAHLAASARVRGIRHAAGWDPSPDVRNSHSHPSQGMLASPRFREGFAQLAPRGLSFDAWLYHHQIPELTELARAFPDTTIVLDHFGGPLGIGPWAGRRREIFERWRDDIRALAACPNVVAKLGGLAMHVNGFGWDALATPPSSEQLAEATGHWYRHAIECFGPERCMFESNFPVDKVSCSYGVLWNSFVRIASGAGDDEKRALFRDTAARVYRLEL